MWDSGDSLLAGMVKRWVGGGVERSSRRLIRGVGGGFLEEDTVSTGEQ